MRQNSRKTFLLQLLSARTGAGLLAFAVGVGLAVPAEALTPAQSRCRDTVSQLARDAAEETLVYRLACVRKRLHDGLSITVDCAADPEELGGPGTGDLATDRRLAKLAFAREEAGNVLTDKCDADDPMSPDDIDPVDLGLDDLCGGGLTEWSEVGPCVIDLAIRSADNIMEQFDLAVDTRLPAPLLRCVGGLLGQTKKMVEGLTRARARCWSLDESLGGGVLDCGATVMPFGTEESTGQSVIDRQLSRSTTVLEKKVRRRTCDKDITAMGFFGAIPEYTGGRYVDRWTLDDVLHGLLDQIHETVHRVTFGTDGTDGIFPSADFDGFCGDGTMDAGEACDDGNNVSCDGCDRDCTVSSCGNGALCGSDGEECDDGNNDNGDGCSATCINERCMNGQINPGYDEECDDGAETFTCDTDCTFAYCGDGYNNSVRGEVCDTGVGVPTNTATCDSDCTAPLCPDGHFNPFNTNAPAPGTGEECDDGGDSVACDANCTPALCGDNYTNPVRGEACDDGDNDINDSCVSSDDVPGSNCQVAFCGDGFLCTDGGTCTSGPTGGTEVCDDGDGTVGSAQSTMCDNDCSLPVCSDGNQNPEAGEACDAGPVLTSDAHPCTASCEIARCGDGLYCSDASCTTGPLGMPEECDDGDGDTHDSCRNNCATATCGDSVVCSALDCTTGPGGMVEQCDGGGQTAVCDTDCSIATCGDSQHNATAGEQCDTGGDSATCDSDCTSVQCTDGHVNMPAGEECDDGNVVNTDTCTNACDVATCGDSILCSNASCDTAGLGPEQCDGGGETMACDLNCTNASCGDGDINATRGEECDDSGESANCDADCSSAYCGDGTQNGTAGETCDDGDATVTDPCPDGPTGNCLVATCGDGFLCSHGTCTTGPSGGTEECDNAGANSDVTPDACRTNCANAFCGDSVTDTGETCDDGDADVSDPCPDGPSGTCATATCGDGFLCSDGSCTTGPTGGTEECDNGGANNDATPDACRTNCANAFCGDGVVDSGESCDDGVNNGTGEGFCLSDCSGVQTCGDGDAEGTEACDDGDTEPCGACDSTCSGAGIGAAVCGDGVTCGGAYGETCDDGDAEECGACNATCDGAGIGAAVCGDSVTCGGVYGEACDDGDTEECGACDSTCSGAGIGAAVCGDGVTCGGAYGEACDDGDTEPCGACNAACNGAGIGAPICGDGVVCGGVYGEQCDDNNVMSGDGCDGTCQNEP